MDFEEDSVKLRRKFNEETRANRMIFYPASPKLSLHSSNLLINFQKLESFPTFRSEPPPPPFYLRHSLSATILICRKLHITSQSSGRFYLFSSICSFRVILDNFPTGRRKAKKEKTNGGDFVRKIRKAVPEEDNARSP